MRIASAVAVLFALAGVAGVRPPSAAAAEGTVTAVPLHHLYRWDPSFMHFYTAHASERDAFVAKGWKDGGPYAYLSVHPFSGGVFFWRLWHPGTGDYYYTADPLSRDDYVTRRGYQPQKAAGYVVPPGVNRPGTVPLYMGYDDHQQHHYYSRNPDDFKQGNYKFVMEACRVWPNAAVVSEIAVTSPKPGDVLPVGTTRTVTWTTTLPGGGVRFSLSTDGGASWKLLTATPLVSPGTFAWPVQGPVTDHARLEAAWVDKVVDTGVSWATSVTGEFRIVAAGSPPSPPTPPPPPPGPNPPFPGNLPPFPGNPPPLPGNPPPNALTLTATPAFGPKVFLSWTAGGPAGVTGYTVERKPKGGVFGVIRVLMGKHVTSMVDAQVAPAFAYRYRVRAWIGLKPSVVSNEVVVPTPAH